MAYGANWHGCFGTPAVEPPPQDFMSPVKQPTTAVGRGQQGGHSGGEGIKPAAEMGARSIGGVDARGEGVYLVAGQGIWANRRALGISA